MHTWFETKVTYEKEIEGGDKKKVSESYLVDALSFTEAEERIIKEMTPFMRGEFVVANIKRAKYADLFEDETGDRWYKAKVIYITIDEKSGAEKRSSANMLIQSSTIHKALENLNKSLNTGMADYEIASITETMIMDIYPYDVEESSKKEE